MVQTSVIELLRQYQQALPQARSCMEMMLVWELLHWHQQLRPGLRLKSKNACACCTNA